MSRPFATVNVLSGLLMSGLFLSPASSVNADEMLDQARGIAHRWPLVDTHIDVPYRLEDQWDDVSEKTNGGDFDYPRAVDGGLTAPFMSIYIPASLEGTGKSGPLADRLIDSMEALVGRAPGKFAMAYNADDILNQAADGKISIAMGMENGAPIEGDMKNLHHFYQRGIRYITLAHSRSNHIADSSYDINRPWKGLSPFGEEVVKEMNRLGIMIDISHISDKASVAVMDMTKAPVIASHSSVRKYTPGWERNISDELIKKVGSNGGVVQINFGSTFVSQASRAYQEKLGADRTAFMEANAITDQADARLASFVEDYKNKAPFKYASLDDVLNNFDHVVELVGVEHVGIGSDYDGVGDSLPIDLKDVSSYPNLIRGLLERGYTEADIKKIMFENTLRVWKEVERVAQEH
ncbi:MAG: dipeptidase [Lysobacterales bacterium]